MEHFRRIFRHTTSGKREKEDTKTAQAREKLYIGRVIASQWRVRFVKFHCR